MCEKNGNRHIKSLFDKNYFIRYDNVHYVITQPNYYTKATNGQIIDGPFNDNIDFNVIQLNHYKCKTFPEFQYARSRQRADIKEVVNENVLENFNHYNINEIQDLTEYHFNKLLQ